MGQQEQCLDIGIAAAEATNGEEVTLQLERRGAGPLLQRDYVAVIEGSARTPEEILTLLREQFARFSPEELAKFVRPENASGPLEKDDVLGVYIKGTGYTEVLMTQVDERSLSMRTAEGHPEAGRITFGAHYDEAGQLVFRIRSRARAGSRFHLLGYAIAGIHLQTRIWVTFIERVAEACGGRIRGKVIVSTDVVEEEAGDVVDLEAPTFPAVSGTDGSGNRE